MESSHYIYTTLNEAANEIRLLTLLPAMKKEPVQALLHSIPLTKESIPEFEALSYCWGSPDDPLNIFVKTWKGNYIEISGDGLKPSRDQQHFETHDRFQNLPLASTASYVGTTDGEGVSGQFRRLSVTGNLGIALPYLRYTDRVRVLWIDAICVNQQNLKERSSQVQRMSDIYSMAKRVIAWLGPESMSSSLAMSSLATLSTKIQVDWSTYNMTPISDDPGEAHWADVTVRNVLSEEIMCSIYYLLDRSWFGRLWIWQEIQFANHASLLLCGDSNLLWRHFCQAIYILYSKGYAGSFQLPGGYEKQLRRAMTLCQNLMKQRLGLLLAISNNAECVDPRDHIFAILSLAWERQFAGLRPDYTKSIEEVFREAVLLEIRTTDRLDILNLCNLDDNMMGLPSWVPDFSRPLVRNPLNRIHAIGSSLSQSPSANLKALKIQGLRISILRNFQSTRLPEDKNFQTIFNHILKLAKQFDMTGRYINGEDLTKAFCRTLVANYFGDRFSPTLARVGLEEPVLTLMDIYLKCTGDIEDVKFEILRFYMNSITYTLPGRGLFMTQDGHIGLCPPSSKCGDQVFCIIGSRWPLILRPQKDGTMLVVGEAYCHGVMNGEPFLGQLAPHFKHAITHGGFAVFLDSRNGKYQREDPRLGPLPDHWKVKSHDDESRFLRFTNKETGDETTDYEFDPRRTPEALKNRGIKLEDIVLV